MRRYNADPRFSDVPVAALLSKDYARKRAALIDPKKANCAVPAGQPLASDTTYFTVIDREGNIALPFNTSGMYRGYVDPNGKLVVEIYK